MKISLTVLSLLIFFLGNGTVFASNVATQTVTFSINPIAEITISGDPPELVATAALPGGHPADVSDQSTYYAITTNGCSQKITASLNSPMPTGTTLQLMINPPTGATCIGCIPLDLTEQNSIVGITQVAEGNLQISYIFQSTADAGIIPSTSRIVTFTLAP